MLPLFLSHGDTLAVEVYRHLAPGAEYTIACATVQDSAAAANPERIRFVRNDASERRAHDSVAVHLGTVSLCAELSGTWRTLGVFDGERLIGYFTVPTPITGRGAEDVEDGR